MNSIPAVITYVDKEQRYQYVNEAFESWFNIKAEAVIGKHILEVLGEEGYGTIRKNVEAALNGKVVQYEREIPYKPGKRYVDVTYTPDMDEEGKVKGFIALINDISSKKKIEAALFNKNIELNDLEHQQQQIIHALPTAFYSCDQDGRILFYNKAAVKLWGREPEAGEDVWCGSYRLFHPDGRELPHDECFMALAIREKKPFPGIEVIVERPDGSRSNILAHPQPTFDSDGNLTGAINLLVDITDRKLAEENTARLAAIVKSSDDAIISKTLEGTITSWNNAAHKMFGYSAEEMIGQPITRLFPEGYEKEEIEILERLKKGQTISHFQTQRTTKDGNILDISISVSPLRNAAGTIIGASKIARDITTQKKTEKTLAESEARFRIVTDSAPVMIWIAGVDKLCIFFNKGWLEFTGRTIDQELGNGWSVGLHPDDFNHCLKTYNESFDSRSEFKNEYRLRRHDGQYRWVLNHGVPHFSQEKQFLGYIGSCIDIHEEKMMNQRKDDFIALASHELKTPLTSAKAYINILEETLHENSSAKTYASKADHAIRRLNNLISDLLDVTKLQHGKLPLNFEEFNFDDMLKEVIATVQMTSPSHKIVKTGILSKKIKGDKNRIEQVCINLLTNAVKYSPGAGRVEVDVSANVEEVLIKVTDFGIGIPKNDLKNVFSRFYRVERKKEQFQGLGIGLYVAHEIVSRHNGSMWVESNHGQGSTFYFTLPLSKVTESVLA